MKNSRVEIEVRGTLRSKHTHWCSTLSYSPGESMFVVTEHQNTEGGASRHFYPAINVLCASQIELP